MAMQGRRKQARAGIAAGQRQNSQLSWLGRPQPITIYRDIDTLLPHMWLCTALTCPCGVRRSAYASCKISAFVRAPQLQAAWELLPHNRACQASRTESRCTENEVPLLHAHAPYQLCVSPLSSTFQWQLAVITICLL